MTTPTAHIWGAGSLGWFYIPKLLAALKRFRATDSIATTGVIELNLRTMTEHPQDLTLPNAVNVTPLASRVVRAGGFRTDASTAVLTRDEWEPLILATADKVILTQQRLNISGAEAYFKEGMHTGHDAPSRLFLHRIREQDPGLDIVASSVLPEQYAQRPQAVIGYRLFDQLQEAGIVLTTVLTDNGGPFARTHTLDAQDSFQANTEAALIGASSIFGRNKTFAELVKPFQSISPFVGLSFASRPLQAYRKPLLTKLGQLLVPNGTYYKVMREKHVVDQAMLTTETAVEDPTTRGLSDAPDLNEPALAVFIIPVNPKARDTWRSIASKISREVARKYPTISCVFCAGHGVPHPGHFGESWLQVSLLYALPAVPTPIREFIKQPLRTTVSETEPFSSEPSDPVTTLISDARNRRNGKEF